MAAKKHPGLIRESYYGSQAHKVDRDNSVIRGVKILGAVSKNGYRYSPSAIANAAQMYEGLGCYINHQYDDHPDGRERERDFNDLFGRFESVTHTDTDVYGDLHFIKSHTLADRVCEAAERFPQNFGLSHEAYWGERREVNGEMVIESIARVSSVDIVTSPATNNGLFESVRQQELIVPKKQSTIRKLLEASGAKGLKILKRIRESDPLMSGIASPEMLDSPMEIESAPEEMGAEDMMEQARDAQVLALINDDSKDVAAKLAAIEAILNAHGDIQTAVKGGGETKPDPEEKPTMESIVVSKLSDQVRLLEAKLAKMASDDEEKKVAEANRSKAKAVFEAADVEATEERLDAIVLIADPEKQKRLVESWPRRSDLQLGERPDNPGRLRESQQPLTGYTDAKKSFESLLPTPN